VIRTPNGGGVRGALFALRLDRSAVLTTSRTDDPGALDAGRRQGAAQRGDRVSRPASSSSTRRPMQRQGRSPDGYYTIPIGKAEQKAGSQVTVVLLGSTPSGARCATPRGRRSVDRSDRPAFDPCRGTRHDSDSVRKTRKLLIVHEDNSLVDRAEIQRHGRERHSSNSTSRSGRLLRTRTFPAMGLRIPLLEVRVHDLNGRICDRHAA